MAGHPRMPLLCTVTGYYSFLQWSLSVAKKTSLMRGRTTFIMKRWFVNHTLTTLKLLFLAQLKLGPVGVLCVGVKSVSANLC